MPVPLVFNDDPFNLVQISLSGSVGMGGKNAPADTMLIQRLLNAVPSARGGPTTALKVDGLIGLKTIGAITRFQTAQQLPVDGRIDAYKGTILRLVPLVRSLGSLPVGLQNLGQPDARVARALVPRAGVAEAGSASSGTTTATKWRFKGSGAAGFSVGYFGATGGDFLIESDDQPNVTYRLSYVGVTVGVSTLPVGFDVAFENMPSTGTRIRKSLFSNLSYDKPGDFVGSCNLLTVEGNMLTGVAGTGVWFIGGAMSSAYGALAGGQFGMPSVGINLCVGAVAGWR